MKAINVIENYFGQTEYYADKSLYKCNWGGQMFYVVDSSIVSLNDKGYWDNKRQQIAKLKDICLILRNDKDSWEFGILSYFEFERAFINRHIKYRSFSQENLKWLKIQLNAQHGSIRFLPSQMIRVEKIITLNSSSLLKGEIHYLRTFVDGYKMTRPMITREKQLERYIYGIPENEYPSDELDDIIYKAVKAVYPMAERRSKLFLFESALLDIRRLKEYDVDTKKIFVLNRSTNMLSPITDIEISYMRNAFRENDFRDVSVVIDCRNDSEAQRISKRITEIYEPLSKMNI